MIMPQFTLGCDGHNAPGRRSISRRIAASWRRVLVMRWAIPRACFNFDPEHPIEELPDGRVLVAMLTFLSDGFPARQEMMLAVPTRSPEGPASVILRHCVTESASTESGLEPGRISAEPRVLLRHIHEAGVLRGSLTDGRGGRLSYHARVDPHAQWGSPSPEAITSPSLRMLLLPPGLVEAPNTISNSSSVDPAIAVGCAVEVTVHVASLLERWIPGWAYATSLGAAYYPRVDPATTCCVSYESGSS